MRTGGEDGRPGKIGTSVTGVRVRRRDAPPQSAKIIEGSRARLRGKKAQNGHELVRAAGGCAEPRESVRESVRGGGDVKGGCAGGRGGRAAITHVK